MELGQDTGLTKQVPQENALAIWRSGSIFYQVIPVQKNDSSPPEEGADVLQLQVITGSEGREVYLNASPLLPALHRAADSF